MLNFVNDESGFVVSAELVLIATLLVIGLIVGLSEVQHAVVSELNDVGEAIGRVNQSFFYTGFAKFKTCGFSGGRIAAYTAGSAFFDSTDECDLNECALACVAPVGESYKFGATSAGLNLGSGVGIGGTGSIPGGSIPALPPLPGPTCAATK